MESIDRLKEFIAESIEVKKTLLSEVKTLNEIVLVADVVEKAFRNEKRVFFAGNGGSAADAQHLATEFVSRFEFDRPGLSSMALSTDTSVLTAIGNDYGFELIFQRQLSTHANRGDVFIGITTSGKSPNVIRAFEICESIGVRSIALCGRKGISTKVDYELCVDSERTARIQECHILIGHLICAEVERRIFDTNGK